MRDLGAAPTVEDGGGEPKAVRQRTAMTPAARTSREGDELAASTPNVPGSACSLGDEPQPGAPPLGVVFVEWTEPATRHEISGRHRSRPAVPVAPIAHHLVMVASVDEMLTIIGAFRP